MSDLIPVEYRTERVLTTEQLAQAYECETNNIKKNFTVNKDRFEEGKHYYLLKGDALRAFKDEVTNRNLVGKNASHLYLWTRRGASRHSKMLGTDRAWEMFDALEENYFNPRPKALTPAEQMAQGLIAAQKLLAEKDAQIREQKPKVLFADAVETSKTSILIGELAKLIKQNGVDIGQNRLFAWMRENGYIVKGGSSKNMPTQKSMKLGIMEIKERTISNPDGSVRLTKTPKVTGKGQTYFVNKFLSKESKEA